MKLNSLSSLNGIDNVFSENQRIVRAKFILTKSSKKFLAKYFGPNSARMKEINKVKDGEVLNFTRNELTKIYKLVADIHKKNLEKFNDLKQIPSLLIRTLNDYGVEGKRCYGISLKIVKLWEESGLTKADARNILASIYILGKDLNNYLDIKILTCKSQEIDSYFKKGITALNAESFLSKHPYYSKRMLEALQSGSTNFLSNAEATSLSYYQENPRLANLLFGSKNDRVITIKDEGLTKYNFNATFNQFFLFVARDHIFNHADPVFIFNSFYLDPLTKDAILHKSTAKSVGKNLRGANSDYSEWYNISPPTNIYSKENLISGCEPFIVCTAVEDDEWFSDSTVKYVDIAFKIANQIKSLLGPKVDAVITILNLGWEILKFFDGIDSDDLFETKVWALDESQINDTNINGDFEIRLLEIDGDNDWVIRVRYQVTNAIFKGETEHFSYTFDLEKCFVKEMNLRGNRKGFGIGYMKVVRYWNRNFPRFINILTNKPSGFPSAFDSNPDSIFTTRKAANKFLETLKRHKIDRIGYFGDIDRDKRYLYFVRDNKVLTVVPQPDSSQYEFNYKRHNKLIKQYCDPYNLHWILTNQIPKRSHGGRIAIGWRVVEVESGTNKSIVFDWKHDSCPLDQRNRTHELLCDKAIEFTRRYKWDTIFRLNTLSYKFVLTYINTSPVTLFWNSQLQDNFSKVCKPESLKKQYLDAGYREVRYDFYIYRDEGTDRIPLFHFFNQTKHDNMLIASEEGYNYAKSEGYEFVRVEGYILKSRAPNTAPLKLFWHSGRNDHFTTASHIGERDALNAGYKFIRIEGYVFLKRH